MRYINLHVYEGSRKYNFSIKGEGAYRGHIRQRNEPLRNENLQIKTIPAHA